MISLKLFKRVEKVQTVLDDRQPVSYTHLLYNSGTYAKNYLILFEFTAVIVCHRKKLPLIKKRCR